MPAPRRRALACAAALAAVLGNAAPSLTTALPALPAPVNAPVNAPLVTSSPGASTNWSGYIATSPNGTKFTSVSASWVEPTATCTAQNAYSSFWVGLDGAVSTTTEQTGTSVDCSSGQPQYYSWYEMYPAYPVNYSDKVAPGDRFTASVTESGAGNFTLVLTDATQQWSHKVSATLGNAALSSAEVIAEAPSTLQGPLRLADFGQVDFSSATANGQPIGAFTPENVTMARHDRTLATTSALDSHSDFAVTWLRGN